MIPGPFDNLQKLIALRGNHMTAQVESANKWVYFIQNMAWLITVPIVATLIYSNLSNRVELQQKQIEQLQTQLTNVGNRLDSIDKNQTDQMVVLTEVKTIVENKLSSRSTIVNGTN